MYEHQRGRTSIRKGCTYEDPRPYKYLAEGCWKCTICVYVFIRKDHLKKGEILFAKKCFEF